MLVIGYQVILSNFRLLLLNNAMTDVLHN